MAFEFYNEQKKIFFFDFLVEADHSESFSEKKHFFFGYEGQKIWPFSLTSNLAAYNEKIIFFSRKSLKSHFELLLATFQFRILVRQPFEV